MKLPLAIGFLLAIASGLAHGLLTDRWGTPPELTETAQCLESLQPDVEGWSSSPGDDLNDRTRHAAGAEGYFSRSYTDGTTSVRVSVVFGRPGPISLHAPTVCFTNSGMQQLADEVPEEVPLADTSLAAFWGTIFRPPPRQEGSDILTYWSWSPDARSWSNPEDARMHFAGRPYLYKVYFTTPSGTDLGGSEAPAKTALHKFIADFLPKFAEGMNRAPEQAG